MSTVSHAAALHQCALQTTDSPAHVSTNSNPSLRSSRAWVAQTAAPRIIGWSGLPARVGLPTPPCRGHTDL